MATTMSFVGAARRLQPNDVADAAEMIGVTEAHLRTVMEVEGAPTGVGFDSLGHPNNLFEPHRFYANLSGAKRDRAVREGVAYPKWRGPGSYPKTVALRWAQFQKACAIDETAAIKSTSWGLGQIMGEEYDECGYTSPQEMVQAFCESEREQVIAMAKLIQHRKLDVQLRRFPDMTACRAFARAYNGAAYERNNYHVKLQQAFLRWNSRLKVGAPMYDDGVLRVGSRGERVRALQERLNSLGYMLRSDSIFGTRTRDAVLAWKADNDLPLTPEMTAEDLAKLETSPPRFVAPERQEVTAKDLKDESRIISDGVKADTVVKTTVGVLGGTQIADVSGLLDKAQDVTDQAQKAKGIFGQVREFLQFSGMDSLLLFVSQHKVWIMIAAAIAVWYLLRRIKQARVEMHQTGESV